MRRLPEIALSNDDDADSRAAATIPSGAADGYLGRCLHSLLEFVDMLTTTPVGHHGLTAKRFVLDGMPNIDDNVACPASVSINPACCQNYAIN
jgi:hypothetical protein